MRFLTQWRILKTSKLNGGSEIANLKDIPIYRVKKVLGRKKTRKTYDFHDELHTVVSEIAVEANVSRQLLVESALLTFSDVRRRVKRLQAVTPADQAKQEKLADRFKKDFE